MVVVASSPLSCSEKWWPTKRSPFFVSLSLFPSNFGPTVTECHFSRGRFFSTQKKMAHMTEGALNASKKKNERREEPFLSYDSQREGKNRQFH